MATSITHPAVWAAASLIMIAPAHADTYTVPPGINTLKVELKGAGGGAGGADDGGAGGPGIAGSQLVVELAVQAGLTVDYGKAKGGLSGGSYTIGSGTTSVAGGAGNGNGGAGGAGPLANLGTNPPDPKSGSGGGGGGGGASDVSYNGLWARAGGGGGGGAGSWSRAAYGETTPALAPVETMNCATAVDGTAGEDGTGTRAGNPNRGGGGGGGGGGGYQGAAGAGGSAGWDSAHNDVDGAHAGGVGGSCYSPGVTLVSSNPAGGGAGSAAPPSTSDGIAVPAPAANGADGDVVLTPGPVDAVNPMATPGNESATLDAKLPTSIESGDVTSYEFTCSPAMGAGNPLTAAKLPLTVNGLNNDTTYTCTVIANLVDPNTNQPYKTPLGLDVKVAPKGPTTPIAPAGPAAATAVPGLGGLGLVVLSGLLAFFGLRRKLG